jgi:hypothetical protein
MYRRYLLTLCSSRWRTLRRLRGRLRGALDLRDQILDAINTVGNSIEAALRQSIE